MTINNLSCSEPSELYSIRQCVGRGNFGDVYKACDKKTGEIVAVKVVNLEHTDEDINLLAQEIFFLAELKSPYITNYITTMTEDASMWIIMEYCGGGSCADLLKNIYNNGLPEAKAAYITREVVKGLVYLHEQKKIHRDIKAANILLTDEGKVKLGDFGVSGQIRATLKRGTFVGTPFWMAPEVVSKESDGYDEKADIWSLGITVYELLKGSPPLSKCDPMKVMANLPKRKPPVLHGNYSSTAKHFIASCLVKTPKNRPSAVNLLDTDFISNTQCVDLKSDVEMLNKRKSKDDYRRMPKFPLCEKLYDGSESSVRWDFSTTTTADRNPALSASEASKITTSTPRSPLSSNINSPYQSQDQAVTPVTNATSPSFRNYNKRYDVGSPMDIEYPKLQDMKLKSFDYLKSVISYTFNRMYERAHDDETRMYVDEMLDHFASTESKIPGFSEVFVEEISLRLDSIKKYLAK
ncbi:hypothetical protein HG536_0B00410 [Torulaspora globosa]|uniref:non-specific serine/threonine protein kinase n=1 Tax=Torulaspora globosa TaxID=48254 RepID=A0A7G3ZCE4_9SACH|nr:uncharacterized protein HG536_0B00410 [Torulaspora globosa]QLL31180.1 hypothetical protein HG536_0B00410 [Torulaspora globosa]